MKTIRLVVLVCALTAWVPSLFADAYNIIKQRARGVANQPQQPVRRVPARPVQPLTPMTVPGTVTPTNDAPAPEFTPEQETALKKLITNLNEIKAGAKPSAEQTTRVKDSLVALATSEARPAANEVAKLAGELAAAWGDQKMTSREQTRFAKELHRVMNSSVRSAEQAQSAVSGALRLLKFGGLDEKTTGRIAETLQALAAAARS